MRKCEFLFLLLVLLPSTLFAVESSKEATDTTASDTEIKNFLGGSIAYEFGHFKTSTDTANGYITQDTKMNPLGVSGFYAFTYKNLLTTFEVNYKQDNDARLKEGSTIPTSFKNTFGTVRFDYLHAVGKLKQNSGLFLGGGIGYGAIDINQENTARATDQYFSLTMDYGFMQTLEEIPLMYNIVFKHNYGWQTNSTSIKLEKLYISQFSFGVAYAF